MHGAGHLPITKTQLENLVITWDKKNKNMIYIIFTYCIMQQI